MSDSATDGLPSRHASHFMAALLGGDAADAFEHEGWHFLCSGEQLPGGGFHAVVRCRMPPSDLIRTLQLGKERFDTSAAALEHARTLAVQWVDAHPGPPSLP